MNKVAKVGIFVGFVSVTISFAAGYFIGEQKAITNVKTFGSLHADLTNEMPELYLELESYEPIVNADYITLKVVKTQKK